MADGEWGKRDTRGEWQPTELPKPSPLFSLPWKPLEVLKYLFAPEGLLWPWNLFFAALAVAAWRWFTPGMDRTATFRFDWIAEIYLRNVAVVVLVAGGFHLRLYTTRGQGTRFKYTNKWLARGDAGFLFRSQLWDNVFWSLVSGCIVWTGWEAVTLWAYANGIIPYVAFAQRPVYSVLIMLSVVFLRQFHFYWVHRLSTRSPSTGSRTTCTTGTSTSGRGRVSRCTRSSTCCTSRACSSTGSFPRPPWLPSTTSCTRVPRPPSGTPASTS